MRWNGLETTSEVEWPGDNKVTCEVEWHGDNKVTCEVERHGDKARRREVGMASG